MNGPKINKKSNNLISGKILDKITKMTNGLILDKNNNNLISCRIQKKNK